MEDIKQVVEGEELLGVPEARSEYATMQTALKFAADAPSTSTVSYASCEKLEATLEAMLDNKLQVLEGRLLRELAGIRDDLQTTGSFLRGGMLPAEITPHSTRRAERPLLQLSDPSLKSPKRDGMGGCISPSPTEREMYIRQTSPKSECSSPSELSPSESRGTKKTRRASSTGSHESSAGVRAMMEKSNKQESLSAVRDIPQRIMAKFQLRNELAIMRKEKVVYHQWLLVKLQSFSSWWQNLNEPERTGCIANLVTAKKFEAVCIMVILVNSMFIAIATDWEIRHTGQSKPIVFFHSELICTFFFMVELILRLYVHRLYFFVNDGMKINCFDFFIVMIGCLDVVAMITEQTSESATNDNFVLGRIARLLKLTKMFRTMRALRFFKDLVVIMESVANSVAALFWILIMLGMLLFIFALVFLQGAIDYLNLVEGKLEEQELDEIYRHFGSMYASMVSMYSAVSGGNDWLAYYDIIVKFGPVYATMFMAFMFFFMFAMFNILTGLFVEKAVVASKPDVEQTILEEKRKFLEQHRELESICMMLDEADTGTIAWVDFERLMSNPTVVACMSSIGLEVHEPELFFEMLCSNRDELSLPIEVFVDRCMKMKGNATSIDSQRSLFELQYLRRQIDSLAAIVRAVSPRSPVLPVGEKVLKIDPKRQYSL